MFYLDDIGRYFLMLIGVFRRMTKRSVLRNLVFKEIDDFFGRRLQVQSKSGRILLSIGLESANRILLRQWNGTVWQDAGEILPPGEEFYDFGIDFDYARNGTQIVVGARCYNNCQGAVQVLQLNNENAWEGVGGILIGNENSFFGEAVAISADGYTVAVGAPGECNEQGICGGAVYVYALSEADTPHQGSNTPTAEPVNVPASTMFPT